jgi:hypothetical protein
MARVYTLEDIAKFGTRNRILPWEFDVPEHHLVDILEATFRAIEHAHDRILTTPESLESRFIKQVERRYGGIIKRLDSYFASEHSTADREDEETLENIRSVYNTIIASQP